MSKSTLLLPYFPDVDVQLPSVLEGLLQNICQLLVSVGVVASVLPYFLVACVPIGVFYFWLIGYFSPTQRELKRLDNISRSPLLSQLTTTLQGLPTLHAYGREKEFCDTMYNRLDANNRAFYSFWMVSRWFAIRLDLVTIMMTAATALMVVFISGNINPQTAGLALLYCTGMGGVFQVRFFPISFPSFSFSLH